MAGTDVLERGPTSAAALERKTFERSVDAIEMPKGIFKPDDVKKKLREGMGLVLVGMSNGGKSTWAKAMAASNPEGTMLAPGEYYPPFMTVEMDAQIAAATKVKQWLKKLPENARKQDLVFQLGHLFGPIWGNIENYRRHQGRYLAIEDEFTDMAAVNLTYGRLYDDAATPKKALYDLQPRIIGLDSTGSLVQCSIARRRVRNSLVVNLGDGEGHEDVMRNKFAGDMRRGVWKPVCYIDDVMAEWEKVEAQYGDEWRQAEKMDDVDAATSIKATIIERIIKESLEGIYGMQYAFRVRENRKVAHVTIDASVHNIGYEAIVELGRDQKAFRRMMDMIFIDGEWETAA